MMTRRNFSRLIGGAFPGLAQSQRDRTRPPNFVLMLADDLGWGDPGCYDNSVIRTPNIDRIAAGGARLTHFYATPTCTPSRAALLTGRYPIRSGMTRVLIPREHFGLPESEVTLAKALRGYRSTCIGKWHLGSRLRYRPTRHGFDDFLGILYSHDMTLPAVAPLKLIRGEKPVESPVRRRRLASKLTEEAVRFIGENKDNPFFLYLPYHLPHVPWMPAPEFRAKSRHGLYGDAVEEMDWSIGEVLQALERNGVDGNTVVLFTSDNGPELNTKAPAGSTGGLRGGKGTTWEGGVRVPCVARWPGRIPEGVVLDGITSIMDVFPTFLTMAGIPALENRAIDGVDLSEYLTRGAACPRDHVFLYRGNRIFAVRSGPWKLHFFKWERPRKTAKKEAVRCEPLELYHLGFDPGEQRNVASEHKNVVERLTGLVDEFVASVSYGRLPPPKWRSVLPKL